jgi:hypothetical protein
MYKHGMETKTAFLYTNGMILLTGWDFQSISHVL